MATKISPHLAAAQGDLATIATYLKEGGLVDKRDTDQWTPCMVAVREGHVAVAQQLLRAGANVEARESDRWTALHVAAANGQLQCCQMLLDRGAKNTVLDENKRTPLHWATRYGYADVVEVLLKRGANADAKDAEGDTPSDVIGRELDDGTRQIIHDLLEQYSAAVKLNRAEQSPRPSIPPTTGLPSDTERNMAPSLTTCSESQSGASGQNLRLPNLGLMPSANVGDGELGRGGPGPEGNRGGGDSGSALNTLSTVGGANVRRRHRRASYSNATHIRDRQPPASASSALPPSPVRGQPHRQSSSTTSASDNVEQHHQTSNTTQQNPGDSPTTLAPPSTPGIDSTKGGELDISDKVDREKHAGAADSNGDRSKYHVPENSQERRESDVVAAGLRRALTLAEERVRVAEQGRYKEEAARLDAEARARALEARVAELEEMCSSK